MKSGSAVVINIPKNKTEKNKPLRDVMKGPEKKERKEGGGEWEWKARRKRKRERAE